MFPITDPELRRERWVEVEKATIDADLAYDKLMSCKHGTPEYVQAKQDYDTIVKHVNRLKAPLWL